MHDIKAIREDSEAFAAALARRNLAVDVAAILALDGAKRAAETQKQQAEAGRKAASKAIGQAKAQKDEARSQALMEEVEALKAAIAEAGAREAAAASALHDVLAALPNPPAEDAPDGPDETGNIEVRRWGQPRAILSPRDHVALGEGLGLMDFERAAKMSGARFVVLKGALARLERALGAFMIDIHTQEYGYQEISPPLLVRDGAAYGTDKLPKFAEDLFKTTNAYWLISTAEMSLTALVMDQILNERELPLRFTAVTPCFRSEAGSAGRDVRGMIRQHQFYKVELVSITAPEHSVAEHERMTQCAETILERLELPFRRMLLCTGDMGFGARKTYDLEVWLPSQNTYREISSCSNCGDFQARRMQARFRREGAKGNEFVHSLNGSALAVGRTLVAILENFQNEDGSVTIPAALRPYLGGMEKIG